MKIAITGHCNGIGKAIFDKLSEKGHELIGFDIVDESVISIMAKKKF